MAYDQYLAQRVRGALGDQPDLVEKRMLGGVGFMIHGNMACGVHKGKLVVRLGADVYQKALARPHALPFDITGRPMKGWVMVAAEGCQNDESLQDWVEQALEFALTLPRK